jgi:hypothetical protein
MRDERSTDPAALLGALADEIADRLANRLVPQIVEIVEANGFELISHERAGSRRADGSAKEGTEATRPEDGLWTVGRVAAHYDVSARFVYQHADELGCVRLGGGARPRLRFDPDVVRERWPGVGDTLPQPAPTRRRSSPPSKAQRRRGRSSFELLDFDRDS